MAKRSPESTVPESTVPESTVPESTVPESTVPESTVPESTVPESPLAAAIARFNKRAPATLAAHLAALNTLQAADSVIYESDPDAALGDLLTAYGYTIGSPLGAALQPQTLPGYRSGLTRSCNAVQTAALKFDNESLTPEQLDSILGVMAGACVRAVRAHFVLISGKAIAEPTKRARVARGCKPSQASVAFNAMHSAVAARMAVLGA